MSATRDDGGVLDESPSPFDDAFDEPEREPERVSPRSITLSIGMLVTALLLAVLVVLPVPYAVNSPGPTRDVLGEHDGTPLIQISGAETYDSTGELRLTTVSGTGGPGFPSSAVGVIRGWLSPWVVVQPVELLYPPDQTQDQIDKSNTAEMVSSQENATVAALTELGYEVPATLVVAGTVEGSDAEGKVEDGDVIVALDGVPVPDYQGLIEQLNQVDPGATVTLTVKRHGQAVDVPIVTGTKDDGRAQIGVYIDPTFDLPVDVTISIDDIGGPSAGTMFALGIVDKMTPEDEANGKDIAGTGTIDVTGEVGPIGGIRQKLAGAKRDGATWFLAPATNCDEVVGHVPDGLRVVKISTLHDAREAITAIGAGTADSLPTCTR
jgi:PDZ domain-containing protein